MLAKRHKITFVEWTETVNDSGEVVEDWLPIYPGDIDKSSSWASFKDLEGAAFYAAQQTNNQIEGTVMVRYRDDVKAEHKFKMGNRIFDIVGPPVNVDEKNRDLLIRYKEMK